MIDMFSQEWAILCYGRDQREKGKDEGRREAKEEIACKMAAAGATEEFIMEITGLTQEQVKKAILRGTTKVMARVPTRDSVGAGILV